MVLSLRYVFFPKLHCVYYPSFSVRADAESETMTYLPILMILDFYSGIPHGIDTPVDSGYVNDSVILALHHEVGGSLRVKDE
jgi:hypothetical protein